MLVTNVYLKNKNWKITHGPPILVTVSSHLKPSVFHPFNRKDFDIFRSLSNDLLCAVLVSGKSDSAQCCLLLLCRTYKPALIFFRCFKINSVTARSRPLMLKSGAYILRFYPQCDGSKLKKNIFSQQMFISVLWYCYALTNAITCQSVLVEDKK